MDPFLGQIQAFGFDFAPVGWAHCNGQIMDIATNTALFSLLGTTYGGDGRTTFALPDLRGRSLVHYGTGPGLSHVRIGQWGGREHVREADMPSHTHTATLYAEAGNSNRSIPVNNMLGFTDLGNSIYVEPGSAPNQAMSSESIVVQSSGRGQSMDIRNPYLAVNICIATVGIYPPRD